jgi:hypothetical protein
MPVSAFVVYTPRDKEELAVCYFLFSESYRFACKFADPKSNNAHPDQPNSAGVPETPRQPTQKRS